MGHHCILTSVTLLLASEAQALEMEGHHRILHAQYAKLNLQCIVFKCNGVKVLVNMVYVTSNHEAPI